MPKEMPKNPTNAIFESPTTWTSPCHFLSDLPQGELPYSKNNFLLTELVTQGGQLPVAGCDVVVYHHEGIIVAIGMVTTVIQIQPKREQPGHYRTLVACAPMTSIADVPVPENVEDDMARELVWTKSRLDANKCPPTSRGRVPQGAPMRNQTQAQEVVMSTIADGIFA